MFRIATMDCSAERRIRQALEPLDGIRSGFQLGARTLKIDAGRHLPVALDAIRKAGFDPQPVAGAPKLEGGRGWNRQKATTMGMVLQAASPVWQPRWCSPPQAEVLSFFAPDQMAKGPGMAIAALAIWLARSTPYKKAFCGAAARQAEHQCADVGFAVTGAFPHSGGQKPPW